ncbi:MAG: twin-arginine translocase TatA/TatE family subunit [Gammaproteobacteria bacterium]
MQELLVILAIVLLLFGPKRLKNIGSDLGNAIKGFRTAVTDDDKPAENTEQASAKVIDSGATQGASVGEAEPEKPTQDTKS